MHHHLPVDAVLELRHVGDDAHDAAADVTATLDILGVYTSRLRQTEGTATAMQKKEKTRKYFKI